MSWLWWAGGCRCGGGQLSSSSALASSPCSPCATSSSGCWTPSHTPCGGPGRGSRWVGVAVVGRGCGWVGGRGRGWWVAVAGLWARLCCVGEGASLSSELGSPRSPAMSDVIQQSLDAVPHGMRGWVSFRGVVVVGGVSLGCRWAMLPGSCQRGATDWVKQGQTLDLCSRILHLDLQSG